jgi:hypothetical protein
MGTTHHYHHHYHYHHHPHSFWIDHKYPNVNHNVLRWCIVDLAFYGDLELADVVLKVADNTLYLKEVCGGHPAKILGPLTILRDIVLDANKIKAMGYKGIEWCCVYALS